MNPILLIDKYSEGNDELRQVLLTHSTQVAEMALRIARQHLEMPLDLDFVREAAMLHDIGIVRTHAPAIHCHGSEHYLRHGLLGGEILRAEGLPLHARVAERHTGTGLTAKSIVEQQLPLPAIDLVPETLEEQLICYADKFFSKTHLQREKTPEEARRSLVRFGEDGLLVFDRWLQMFGV
ncbi:MAG: HDIG domain-containing protein [Bacteroidales bacterium]|nr:HDIG domain-containing protein [Candidatus Physcousia equi]